MNTSILNKRPIISIMAAIGKNRELGKNNKLLWHIKKDLKHFKDITKGHPVIMGRKTFESIGFPLPNRFNIIISRNVLSIPIPERKNLQYCDSLEKAIELAKSKDKKEIFIIGGASVYKQAINLADKLYLTLVEGKFDADVFFPDYSQFSKVISKIKASEGQYKFIFVELIKNYC